MGSYLTCNHSKSHFLYEAACSYCSSEFLLLCFWLQGPWGHYWALKPWASPPATPSLTLHMSLELYSSSGWDYNSFNYRCCVMLVCSSATILTWLWTLLIQTCLIIINLADDLSFWWILASSQTSLLRYFQVGPGQKGPCLAGPGIFLTPCSLGSSWPLLFFTMALLSFLVCLLSPHPLFIFWLYLRYLSKKILPNKNVKTISKAAPQPLWKPHGKFQNLVWRFIIKNVI